jgi:hypothetical protein
MNRNPFRFVLIFCLALISVSCEQFNKLTATKINDVLSHPRDYDSKEITIHGTVTDAASILVVKYFILEDSTGSIKVVTDRVLPKKGEQLTVTGYLQSIEIGPERWIVLREKTPKQS